MAGRACWELGGKGGLHNPRCSKVHQRRNLAGPGGLGQFLQVNTALSTPKRVLEVTVSGSWLVASPHSERTPGGYLRMCSSSKVKRQPTQGGIALTKGMVTQDRVRTRGGLEPGVRSFKWQN
ncbi:hypothetical protein CRG98_010719 [Punica granatum]|uniref:Uncharacterized protein n=1 Tax=Punica granatum TaxID=22663 RepID=A0A2I0KK29_PUNGR|nr:hypothetical protein CRG98_010719 [Punica granatum]